MAGGSHAPGATLATLGVLRPIFGNMHTPLRGFDAHLRISAFLLHCLALQHVVRPYAVDCQRLFCQEGRFFGVTCGQGCVFLGRSSYGGRAAHVEKSSFHEDYDFPTIAPLCFNTMGRSRFARPRRRAVFCSGPACLYNGAYREADLNSRSVHAVLFEIVWPCPVPALFGQGWVLFAPPPCPWPR